MTDAPRISDDEVRLFRRMVAMHPEYTVGERETFKQALSAFLKTRIPKFPPNTKYWNISEDGAHDAGFNACIDAVLRGKG